MDMNVFEGTANEDGSVDFTYFTLAPDAEFMKDKPAGTKLAVSFEPSDADLSDDPEAGFVTGHIDTIMYIGDHYTYIVRGDNDEEYYADDDWLWNMGDRVSVVVPQDKFSSLLASRISNNALNCPVMLGLLTSKRIPVSVQRKSYKPSTSD